MAIHPFLVSLLGGILIGGSAAALYVFGHRVAGVSGLLGGLLEGDGDRLVRSAFLAGLVSTGAVLALVVPGSFGPSGAPLGRLVLGGLLVGFGTRLGNGCTSGHGVCGVGRLSPRSIAATATFVAVGFVTVGVFRALGGVAP